MEIEDLKDKLKQDGKLYLPVKIRPQAKINAIKSFMPDGTIKIDIAATPENGRANEMMVKYLAAVFALPINNIKLVKGATGHNKLILIKI